MIIPAEVIGTIYSIVEIKEEFVDKLLHGAPVDSKFLIKKDKIEKDKIVYVFANEQFIGMYKIVNEGNVFAKAEFVLQPLKE